MKNLLLVVHYPVFGGPHNQALRLAEPLRKAGWHTAVLIPDEPGNASQQLSSGGVEVITAKLGRLRASKDLRTQLLFAAGFWPDIRRIRRVIREHDIDLVVVGGLVNTQAAFAARLEGIPVVWQLLDTRSPIFLRRMLMGVVTRTANSLMTTGMAVARVHPGALSFHERLFPFHPPVDCEAFSLDRSSRLDVRRNWGLTEDDLVLGSTSNISPQKGIEYLIQTLAEVRAKGYPAKLVLVGSEYGTHREYSESLRAHARRLGLRDGSDVIFAGHHLDIERQLQGFDLFVMASVPRSEGVPTVILEAMASGLPVVATDVGAIREVVEDGQTGFITPPLDPHAMAVEVVRLINDEALRDRLAENARLRAKASFDLDICAREHLRAFNSALDHFEQHRSSGTIRALFSDFTRQIDRLPPLFRRARKALRLLKSPLWRRGLLLGIGATIEHDGLPFRDYRTVIDVGAHKGQFALFALERFPKAKLYCFEPLARPRNKLKAVTSDELRVKVLATAVGSSKGHAAMHVSKSDDSSSLLNITARQTAAFPGTQELLLADVPVDTLDEILRTESLEHPILLKIDVQGFELEVLRSAANLLGDVDSILVECSFREFYEGQPLFDDVLDFLRPLGFCLKGGKISAQDEGVWMQGDFFFERTQLALPMSLTEKVAA